MKIKNLVLLLLSFGMIYLLLFKKEKMSNTDIKKIVSQVYQADIESIRNLSKLANDLTNTGKLVVPGGLEIKGNLKINGTVGVKRDPDPKIGILINGSNLEAGLQSNGKLYVYGESYLMGNVGVKRDPHPKVGLIINGEGLTWGLETSKSGIESGGDINASGNGYFGPAYIGKYKKIHNGWAQFCHKNQAGDTGKYALIHHENGDDTYLNTGKNIWFRQKNSDKLTLINDNFTVKKGSLTVKGNLIASNNKFKVYNNSRGSGEMGLYRKNGKQGIFFTSNYLYKGNKKAGIWTYHGNGGISKSLH